MGQTIRISAMQTFLSVCLLLALSSGLAQAQSNVVTTRAWLGISMQDLDPSLATHFGLAKDAKGVLVADLKDPGPAKMAGLEAGDVIESFAGVTVTDQKELKQLVTSASAGEKVALSVWRNSSLLKLSVTLGEKKISGTGSGAALGAAPSAPSLGMEVRELSQAEAQELHLNSGLFIEEVDKGSPAEAAGIQAGDVLLELEHSSLSKIQDLSHATEQLKAGDSVLIRLEHDSKSSYMSLQLPSDLPEAVSASGIAFSPITIEYGTGWVEDVGPVSYVSGFTHDGLRLRSRSDLENVIDPLGDSQATKLIQDSETEEHWGLTLFLAGGVSVFAGIGNLVYQVINPTTSTDQYGDTEENFPNLVPFFVLLAGGIVTGVYGAILFEGTSDANRTAAVERYNQVINGLKSLSFMQLPNSNQTGLAYRQSF